MLRMTFAGMMTGSMGMSASTTHSGTDSSLAGRAVPSADVAIGNTYREGTTS